MMPPIMTLVIDVHNNDINAEALLKYKQDNTWHLERRTSTISSFAVQSLCKSNHQQGERGSTRGHYGMRTAANNIYLCIYPLLVFQSFHTKTTSQIPI